MHHFRHILVIAIAACGLLSYAPPASSQHKTDSVRESFVPVDQMQAIFDRSPNGVLLQRDAFEELLQKAEQADKARQVLPETFIIHRAEYRVSQQDRHAVINLNIDIQQFVDEWVTIPLTLGHLHVEAATINDQPAAINHVLDSSGALVLVHDSAERFTLQLTLSTPLARVGNDDIAALRLLPNVPLTLNVICPKQRRLEVNGLQLKRPAAIDEETEYAIAMGSIGEATLKWTSQRGKNESQALVFTESDVTVLLNAENLRWNSNTRISVFGTPINRLSARVPTAVEITSVESAGLEDWKLEDDPDKPGFTRLQLNYRQPFSDDRIVGISAVAPWKTSKEQTLPTLTFPDVTAHSGRLIVQHEDQLRLQLKPIDGIRPVGFDENHAQNRSEHMASGREIFDFWNQNYELSVAVRPRHREVFAAATSTLTITDTSASYFGEFTIETLNAFLFDVALNLPNGWQMNQVTDNQNKPLKWRQAAEANQLVVQPLQPVASGSILTIRVFLSKTISDPTTPQTLTLPIVSVVDAQPVSGSYAMSASHDLTIAPLELMGLVPLGDSAGTLRFETLSSQINGQLRISRKPARLTTRSVLKTWMDARQRTVEAEVTVDIVHGTARTLQLQVPESLGDSVRFEVASLTNVPGFADQDIPATLAISQQTVGDVVDGVRPISITFDRRVQGALTLKTYIQQVRHADDKLTAPFVRVVGAVRQHGLIVFEASADQELIADNEPQSIVGLEPTDSGLVDPPPPNSGRRTALVYRYVAPNYAMNVSERRYTTVTVPSAVCKMIRNVSVLSESDRIQRSSCIHFVCSGVQTIRFSLPADEQPQLWSTILDGKAIEVRRDGDDYLVAIPTVQPTSGHQLEILFEGQSININGDLQQQAVSLSIDTEHGQASPVDILEQTWEVRYPSSQALLHLDDHFEPQTSVAPVGWLQTVTSLLQLPSMSTAGARLLPLVVAAVLMCVCTALVIRRRWLSIIGLGICGLPFLGSVLLLPAVQQARQASVDTMARNQEKEMALSGGTELVMESATEEESLDVANFDDAGTNQQWAAPSLPQTNGAGVGGGGFGADFAASNNPFAPPTVDFKLRELSAADSDNSDGLQSHTIRNIAPNEIPGMITLNAAQDDVTSFSADLAARPRIGTARLSIRAAVASPDEYQRTHFRSISSSSADQSLRLVMQDRSHLYSLRLIAAAVMILIGLALRSQSGNFKVGLATIAFLATLAAVPFVADRWQAVVDGLFVGTLLVMGIWLSQSMAKKCCRQLASFKKCGCCGFFRPSTTAAAILWPLIVSLCVPGVQAAGPDETQTSDTRSSSESANLRPDVVLPYSPGQPELLANKVFLPQAEFLRLYKKANPDALGKSDGPTASSVVAAFYSSGDLIQAKDNQWTQQFTARYVIATHQQNSTIALPIGAVGIRSLRLNDEPAILLTQPATATRLIPPLPEPGGVPQQQEIQQQQAQPSVAAPKRPTPAYSIRIPDTGLQTVDFKFDVPATVEGPIGHFELPLIPVASGVLTFQRPSETSEATVNGRSNAFRETDASLTLPIATGGRTKVEWRPRNSAVSSDTSFHATVNSALILQDSGLLSHSTALIQVRQGQLSEVSINLPPDFAVQKVECGNIASWQVTKTDAKPRLKALFLAPVTANETVHITLFRKLSFSNDEQKMAVPLLSINGASRDSGNATVLAGRELEVRVDALSGVSQLNTDQATLPEGIDQDIRRVLSWRYTRHPANVSVRIFRTRDRLVSTSQHGVHIDAERQLWTSLLNINVSGAAQRRFEVRLPPTFTLLDVSGNGLEDWYQTTGTGESQTEKLLQLQFAEPQVGVVSVVIQGQQDRDANKTTTQLQPPQLQGADVAREAAISVWLDAASTLRNFTGVGWSKTVPTPTVRSLRPEDPALSLVSKNPNPQPIVITTDEAAAALVAESVNVTNVTDTSIELTLGMSWEISDNAASREFSFSLPQDLADVYDFQIAGLRQLDRTLNGDRIDFRIQLQQAISERFFVLGTGTLPLPKSGQIAPQPPQFIVPPDSKSTLTSQSHFWVIVNQSLGLLQEISEQNQRIDEASAADIRMTIPNELLQQAVTIRRLRSDRGAAHWQLKFPQQQQVTPAIVALAAHTTIINDDGSWRSRHALQVRNESRQFLPVTIPQGSRFLYATVQEQPTRIVSRTVGDDTLYLIPIPQSGTITTPFEVEFVLSGQIAAAATQPLTIPSPAFSEYRDAPEYGITVSRNTWSVHLPETWQVSTNSDPRKTNVIAASSEDFEDAVVLSGIDNLKSMLNVLSLSSERKFRSGSVLYGLSKQRKLLEAQRGNSRGAEEERQQTLQQLNKVLEDNQLGDDADHYFFDGSGVLPHLQHSNASGTNRYLENNEALQNGFSNSINAEFLSSNDAVSINNMVGQDLGVQFNFTLPQNQPIPADKPQSGPSAGKKSKSEKDHFGRSAGQTPMQRSQLLERRQLGRMMVDDETQSRTATPNPPAVPLAKTNSAPQSSAPESQSASGFVIDQAELGKSFAPDSTGQLSLIFEIPTNGTRHDFVRTGGNAHLSLNVQQTEVVATGFAFAWATACILAAVALISAAVRDVESFAARLIAVFSVIGLIGWLCLPTSLGFLGLVVCITALAITCLTAVVKSFLKGSPADATTP